MSVDTGEFNTGVQRSITLVDNASGKTYVFDNGDFGGDLIDFQSAPVHKEIDSEPISRQGIPSFKDARTGHKGTLTIHRSTGAMDKLESLQEANFHGGLAQMKFTIDELTNNDDGSQDVFQYTGAVIRMTDAGTWKIDSAVPIKIEFRAEQRLDLN